MLYPLKFKPVYMDRIWGGTGLKEEFNRDLPGDTIGESWEITCRKDAMSQVAEGPLAGRRLDDLITHFGSDLIGTKITALREFPLLLKILDARDILSVQVHPDDEYARVHENSLGKTEVWYILKAKPGARIVYGLKPGITRGKFLEALQSGQLVDCLNMVEVKPGEVYPISAGLVHALGAGIMVAEFQQNSDLTYRIYDWDRVDARGNPRPLHVDKALDVIAFNTVPPKPFTPREGAKEQLLVDNDHFRLSYLRVEDAVQKTTSPEFFEMFMVVEGQGEIIYNGEKYGLRYGDSLLLPANLGEYKLEGTMTLLFCAPKDRQG